MHSKIAIKRESTDFYDVSNAKPRIEVAGDSTGATKATGGRLSIGSDVTP